METVFLVLGIIGGIVVGFAGTYFTLVTKLQKKLESVKSKLGRAKSASEDTETLQFQLEAQKAESEALQARLEGIATTHQTELDNLQATSTAAIAQLTADKTALENELQSLRESAPSLEQLPPDNSEELAALQNRLLVMEQEHQATVQSLEADYQSQIAALQESLASSPETETFADDETPVAPGAELEEIAPQDQVEELGAFEEEAENLVAAEFAPVAEETESPFGESPATEDDLENWVDAPGESEQSPFDIDSPVMEAEAPVLEEVEVETAEFTAEAPALDDFSPPGEETESPFGEPAAEEDLENWVDGPAELSLEEITVQEASFDLDSTSESLDLGQVAAELPDFNAGESPMDLGAELPDMTEEPSFDGGVYDVETPQENLALEIEQTGDELLAELTGEGEPSTLPLFTEEPAEQLGDLPSEEILPTTGDGGVDDLDFLLELQDEEEPDAFSGDEFLLELTDDESPTAGFQSEVLAEESLDFPDLLEDNDNPNTHGGDPFINVLDEGPNSSDNDLLALLQNDDSNDGQSPENQGDDDLFPGLENMLGDDAIGDSSGFDDLDALLMGGENSSGSESEEVLSLDDFSLGLEDFK